MIDDILHLCVPLFWGTQKVFLTMSIKKKKNRSGTTSIVVAEKTKGIYKELVTIGVNVSITILRRFSEKKLRISEGIFVILLMALSFD